MNKRFTVEKLVLIKFVRSTLELLKVFKFRGLASFYLLPPLFVFVISLLAFSFSKKHTSSFTTSTTETANFLAPPVACPSAPTNCTFSFNGSCNGKTTLNDGDTLCINSGTFDCEVRFRGGTVYVAPGATFEPNKPKDYEGTIINCGTVILDDLNFEKSFNIQNYGTIEFKDAKQDDPITVYNYEGATLDFTENFKIEEGTDFTNDGVINASGNFDVEDGTFTNNNELNFSGNFQVENNGAFNNFGIMNVGAITINSSTSFYNACTIVATDEIIIESDMVNDGLLLTDGTPGLLSIEVGVTLTNNHEVVSNVIYNDGTILGDGNFWINDLSTQTSNGSIGTDGNALNFYDRSPDQNSNGNSYFDEEQGTIDPSVTVTPPASPAAIPDASYIGPSCGSIVAIEDCTNGIDDDGDLLVDCDDPDCTFQTTINISSDFNGANISCFGASDGALEAVVTSGGITPFSYLWNTSETTTAINTLVAGSYTVTVTDNNGCTSVESINLLQPDSMILQMNATDIGCASAADGLGEVIVLSGGTAPVSYLWNNTETTATIGSLTAGNYVVTVTDANGCTSIDSLTINEPTVLSAQLDSTDVSCFSGVDGSATVLANGGTAPYIYLWSNDSTTQTISTIPPGNYFVTVTDVSGCSVVDSIIVNEPPLTTLQVDSTEITCAGETNGTASVVVTGANAPFSYLWSTAATTQNINNLSIGVYRITVTDSNGCTYIDSTRVTAIPDLTLSNTITTPSCFGESDGAVDLVVTGGTAPFSFIWNNGTTTEDLSGISSGSYFVTTTDFNGCIALDTALVADAVPIGVSFNTVDVACNGDSTGTIDMTVFNGTAPYTYLWSHGVTVEDPDNLPAGNYTVTITDNLACSIVFADTISEPTPIVASPSVTDVSCYGGTDGFVIETNATGGTPGYHYNWSDFDAEAIWTFEGTTDDITGNNNHAQGVVGTINYVTDTIERENAFLFDGATKIRYSVDNAFMESNYTQKSVSMWVKPTDFSGIQTLIEEDGNLYGFTIRLNETDLEIAVEKTFIFNFNREYDTPFPTDGAWHHIAYTWDDGDLRIYLDGVLVITDNFVIGDMFSTGGDGGIGGTFYQDAFNNFNDNFYRGRMDNVIYHNTPLSQQQIVDIMANDGTRSSLDADSYIVTITDANGCSANETVTVDQPDPMTIVSDSTNVSCAGASDGAISLTVSGGVGPYTYQWSNDSTTQVITNLISGGYTVTVTDFNGCSITDSTTVNDVPLLTLNHTATASSCFGGNDGTVNLVVTGGTAPYNYVWDQGATTEDLLGVSAGNYNVTVTDVNGCTATESATVDNASIILVTCNNVNASCYEGSDGSIDVTITGGTAPYSFLWNNGATVEDLTNLIAGIYTVTITDNLSCSVIHSDTITQPDSITIAANLTNVSCFGGADGAVLGVNTSGGTPGYNYNWNDMEAEAIWTFENTADDISGNGHHPFAIDGNVLYVADTIERNTAFRFDGNTRIRYSNPPFMNTSFSVRTISMWLKDDDTNTEQTLFEEGYTQNGFAIRFKNGNIEGSIASGNVRRGLSEPYPTDGDWHHVALVYDNGEMYLYLDGDLLDSRSTGFGTISYPFSVTGGIGGIYFSDAFGETDVDNYTGYMDDVRYHTVALTEDQIEDMYDRTGNRHNLTANSYNLTVTDENGCTNVLEIEVTQPTELEVAKDSTAVSCFGGSDGSLNIVVTGGVAPYSYLWSTGVTTSNLTGLSMGTYTVTVTDDNSCILVDSILILEPNEISLSAVVTDASCNGGTDGSIDLTVTDGQAPLSFQWNNGAGMNEDPSGLSAGNYIVTVTDNAGCTMTDTILVEEPAGMSLSSVVSEISCNGGADGEIDVTVTGGSSPYTFQWDNGAGTDEDPTGLAANTYQVTVTDNNSCTIIESITLIDPTPATITGITTEVTCENGSDGTIDLSVSGGTPDYTYWWSDWDVEAFYPFEFHSDDTTGNGHYPTGFSQATIFFSDDAVNGDYSIAMDDYLIRLSEAGGFMETAFTTRTVMMWVKPDNLGGREILFEEGSDVHGMAIRLNNSTLEAAVSRFSTVEFAGNHTFPNDGAWHHVALVFDNGDLTLYLDGVAGATTSTGFANIQTNGGDGGIGGSIFGDVFNNPGSSFYHGLMDDLIYANEAFSPVQITEAFNNDGDRTGLSAGTYTVFVHDANGCITTQDFTITELPPLVLSFDSTDVSCNGFLDGTIDLTVTGGTTPYTYLWSAAGQTTQDLTALGAGTYTVTVTDANTCTSIDVVTINEPLVLTATVDSTDVICNGTNTGSANLTVGGGSGSYNFVWSNGATTEDLTNIGAGVYTVTVTDANACSVILNTTVNEPTVLQAQLFTNDVNCFGNNDGEMNVIVSGGTAGYNYLWSNGITNTTVAGLSPGNYTLTVTDANACTIVLSGSIAEPSQLNVTADTESVSCNAGDDGRITNVVVTGGTADYYYSWSDMTAEAIWSFEDSLYDVSGNANHPNGIRGTIAFSTDAAEGDYALDFNGIDAGVRYSFNGAFMESTFTERTVALYLKPNDLLTRQTIYDEGGSFYGLSIELFNGNIIVGVAKDPATITTHTTPFPNDGAWHHLAVVYNNGDLSLYLDGGLISTVPTGLGTIFSAGENGGLGKTFGNNAFGNPGDLYYNGLMDHVRWHNVALTANQLADMITHDGTRNNLTAGTYTLVVSDENACTETINLTIGGAAVLTANLVPTNISCFNGNDGAINLIPSGGAMPLSFIWSNGATTEDLNGVTEGRYDVTVTDNNGCTLDTFAILSQPTALTLGATVTSDYNGEDVSCGGATDGNAVATAAGGAGSYLYAWQNGQIGPNLTNVGAGTYVVTVTDANSCSSVASVTLTEPTSISLAAQVTSAYNGEDVSCAGAADAVLEATASGGNGSYSYLWTTTETTSSISGVAAGSYSVTVTDDFGCTSSASVSVSEPTTVTTSIGIGSDFNGFPVSCDSGADGDLNSTSNGGTGSYTYLWTTGATTSNISGLGAGTYILTVTDQNGCTAADTISLVAAGAINFTAIASDLTDCGINNGQVSISATGGTGNFEYRINGSPWQTDSLFSGLSPGTYDAYVRNAFGTCISGPRTVVIDVPESPTINNIVKLNPTTGSSTDGSLLVNATGNLTALEYRINIPGPGWTPWQSSTLFENLEVGVYDVEVKYNGQNCIAATQAELVAGGGISGNGGGVNYCSDEINGAQFVEAYYIPAPEDQILQSLQSIYSNNAPLSCGITSRAPSDPVSSYVGIGIVEDGVVVYFDHWEDGYEVNLSFPVQGSTEIWGDNNPANGIPPGFTVDILTAADQIVLNNDVVTTTRQSVIDYDGGDKVAALGNIAMTRLAWANQSSTLLAGALEVYPVTLWGTNYEIPVGENTDVNQMFEYTGAYIMAQNDGTTVNIDVDGNGSFEITTTLNQGQSYLINGNLNSGGEITASSNVQVHLVTGDVCSTFESRFFTLKPTVQWSDSYYSPVSTQNDLSGASNDDNHPTYVHLYNPNSTSIRVFWETSGGPQPFIDINPGQTAWEDLPDGSGAHFYTTNGMDFYAVATIDSDPDGVGWGNSAHDWGFALIPESQLSSQITLVGFAPGMDPDGNGLCCTGNTWGIFDSSSEDTGSGSLATNAIDGDESTIWHTNLSGTPGYPHFIEVDLGSTNNFTGFRYTPRQDGSTNGTIAGYELYSWDGGAYVFITSGTWASNTDVKEVYFPEVTSRYIRLVAISEINGNNWASAAELEVLNPENSSPVWVTADYPTGSTSTGPITLCIDYDGDNSGPGYDTQITLNPLEIVRLRDIIDNDNDQTGMRIWVCDGSDAIIAGAWGQDPANASGSSPAIDLGTGLPNGIPFAATKCVDISKDYNLNGLFDECDEIIYTIVIRNTGALSLSTGAVRITDTLSNNLTYVEGTTFTRTGGVSTLLADDTTPNSPFPLDEGGTNYNSVIAPGDSVIISFEAVINNVSAATFINNEASIFNANKELIPSVAFPVEDPELPALTGVPANATVSCDSVPNAPMINDVNCNLGSVNYPPNQSENSTAMDGQTIATGTTNTTFSIVDGTIIRDFRVADFRYPRDASENLPCGASTRAIHFSQRERESNSEYGAGTNSTVRIDFSQAVENLSFSINDLDENLFHLDAVVVRIFDASNAELDYDCGYFTYGSKVEQVGDKEFQALDNSFGYEAVNDTDADGDIRFAFYNLNIRRVEITYKNNWTVNSNSSNFTQTNFDDYMNANNNSEQDIGIGQICYCIPGTNEGTVFVANDCANNTNIVYNETRTDGSCPYNYVLTRTWTATDHCGNISTESQELTIQDIEAPVLSDYPVDLTVALDSVPPVPTITATDNCGIAVVSFAADTTTNVCEVTIRRTWTAVDECSNSVSHSQNILINAVISASTLITSDYNGEDISCNGASDGSAVVRFEGGQAPITFLWSTGSLDSTITNVPAGNYTVTVTDNNGCQAVATVELIEPSVIAVTANVTSDYNGEQISCSGGSDGTAFASAIGGTPPISFLWSTGQTTQNIVSLSSGTYFVTATDSNGCEEVESVTLTDPPPFTTNPTVISNYNGAQVSCTGASDANISPGVMGGIGTLSFVWSNGDNTPVLSNVNAGTYFVTVTDANGCTTVGSTTVSNPPPINLSLNVTSDYNGADISCTGESDGSATVVASGGVGGFTYEWNTGSVSTNLSGLNSNTYTVTVTDNNGCTAIGNITLNDPSPLIVDGSIVTNISCNSVADGTATAVATGGTGAISYSWSNGQNGANATGLAANTYIVTAEDANACIATDTLVISDPSPITLETSIGVDPSYCQAMDGTITVVATGGANDFEYRLNSSPWQTDTTFTGLGSGTYYIYVRNINGTCEVNPDSIILTDPIPSACPIITDTDPLIVCSSAINVPFSVAALFGADSYIWTTPDGTNVVSGQGTNSLVLDINGLVVGTYTICVETVSACGVSPPCCYNFEVITCSEICNNGIDDDGDGLIDCLDPECEPTVDIIEPAPACINETVSFEATDSGTGAIYNWSFGANAVPTTATGIGPHDIVYINCGNKRITVAVELNGCMAYDTMFLDIIDTELPTFTTPANITIDCDDVYTDLTVTGDVTDESDNCSINLDATYVDDLTQLTGCGNTGMVQRTWFLTDDCGNGTSAVQTITIQDTIPPTAINGIPADTTVSCNEIPSPPAIGTTITGADDCDPAINISLNETNDQTNNGSCTDYNYTITRTWTAIDDCGNFSTAVQQIQVADTEPPLPMTGIPTDVTVNCDAIPSPPTIGTDITTTDNCDPSVDIVLNETDTQTNDGSCSDNNYVITRVWNATDACGNTTVATQLITVIDTMPPTALTGIPSDVLVNCDAIPAPPAIGSIGSSDNCDSSLDISMVESSNQTNNQTCTDNNYVITRTWIAIDNCGNNTTALQIITVVDNESPVLSGIPGDTIVNCDNIPSVPPPGTITGTDNCTAATDISINLVETSSQTNNGSCNDDSYSILRLWVATDLCGNTATAQQIIQVVDNAAPTFTLPLPTNITVSCDEVPTTIDTLTAMDNCVDSASVNILFVQSSDQTNNGTCTDNNYMITRTWTAVDRCGNNTTHQQIITVIDTISPYFTSIIPADTLVSCNGIPLSPTITASDGCDSDSELVITLNETSSQTNTDNCTDNNYSINRTWTATDQCGNTVTAQQIITVFDSEAPTITIAARDTIVECDGTGNNGALNDWINRLAGAAATDNCDNTIDWSNDYDGLGVPTLSSCDTDTSGILEVIFTATDNCGNNSSTTARFIIIDTNDPIITASVQDTIVECDGLGNLTDLNIWLNNNGGAIADDDCNSGGGFTWTNDYDGAGVPGLSACDNDTTNTLVVVFTATDFCGNTVSQTANFTIIDSTPPSLTPVNDITVDCDDIPVPVAPTAADDCDPSIDIVYQEVTVYHPSTNWKSTGSCSLVQTISAASYDDKGTASTSDDEMSFTLTVIGQNTGAMWSAMVNGVLISGAYYRTYEFGPILSNGSVLNFTIIDNADGGCTLPVELDIADF
ncbi:MAG: LamG-like jellyroll fold domain-containing protein [Saprospiraceae bacterium]